MTFVILKNTLNHIRISCEKTAYVLFAFTAIPTQPEPEGVLDEKEIWFGLKAYIESDVAAVRILGWITVITLIAAIMLAIFLAVSRLFTLWDLWFEEIRRPDRESLFNRILRISSFWLAVSGVICWIACKLIAG